MHCSASAVSTTSRCRPSGVPSAEAVQRREDRIVRAADSVPVHVARSVARRRPHSPLGTGFQLSRVCGDANCSFRQVRHVFVVRVTTPMLTPVKGGGGAVGKLPFITVSNHARRRQPNRLVLHNCVDDSPVRRPDADQHAMAASTTRALSVVQTSSALRIAECHSRRTLVSCDIVRHLALQHVPLQSPDFCSVSPLKRFATGACDLAAFFPGPELPRRASVGKLPYIIFVVSGETRSDLARSIAPPEKVVNRGPSFAHRREIDRRR